MDESLTSNLVSLYVSRQAGEKTGADGGRKELQTCREVTGS